jgi:UPF0716 family protein affecting phage T7 exclusion
MDELLKIVGVVGWAVGLFMLFFSPIVGLAILGVALLLTIRSAQQTRERRHQELLNR